jgi:quercetin dioxygenase-like cupin family protein
MRRFYRWGLVIGSIVTIAGLGVGVQAHSAVAQTAVPTPQVVRESRFDIADAPAVGEVVQQVVNFPPGAWTSPHSHGGQAINLVMEGVITFRRGDEERKYPAGEAWSDPTGEVHAAGNETTENAALLTNFLLPSGATQTAVQGTSDLQPQVRYEARFRVTSLPARSDVVQLATDFAPGAWREPVAYGGQAVHVVVSGEITYRADGQEKVYRAGESWQDAAGHAYSVGNISNGTSRLFTTVLLPDGVELTRPVDATDFPPTQVSEQGDGGINSVAVAFVIAAGLIILANIVFLLVRRGRAAR